MDTETKDEDEIQRELFQEVIEVVNGQPNIRVLQVLTDALVCVAARKVSVNQLVQLVRTSFKSLSTTNNRETSEEYN